MANLSKRFHHTLLLNLLIWLFTNKPRKEPFASPPFGRKDDNNNDDNTATNYYDNPNRYKNNIEKTNTDDEGYFYELSRQCRRSCRPPETSMPARRESHERDSAAAGAAYCGICPISLYRYLHLYYNYGVIITFIFYISFLTANVIVVIISIVEITTNTTSCNISCHHYRYHYDICYNCYYYLY